MLQGKFNPIFRKSLLSEINRVLVDNGRFYLTIEKSWEDHIKNDFSKSNFKIVREKELSEKEIKHSHSFYANHFLKIRQALEVRAMIPELVDFLLLIKTTFFTNKEPNEHEFFQKAIDSATSVRYVLRKKTVEEKKEENKEEIKRKVSKKKIDDDTIAYLDIGGGAKIGRAWRLAESGKIDGRVVVVDLEKPAFKNRKPPENFEYVQKDALKYLDKLEDHSVEKINMDFVEHSDIASIYSEKPGDFFSEPFLDEVTRVLKPGGEITLSVGKNNLDSLKNDFKHMKRFKIESIKDITRKDALESRAPYVISNFRVTQAVRRKDFSEQFIGRFYRDVLMAVYKKN